MIYSVHNRLGFIHVPRTAGTSITAALKEVLTKPAELFGVHLHATAYWAREYLLGHREFDEMQWFAVWRNPVDLLLSYKVFTNDQRPFPEYFEDVWTQYPWKLSHGGFVTTYLSDPDTGELYPNVFLARFDTLVKDLDRTLSEGIRLPAIAHCNQAQKDRPTLTKEEDNLVFNYCWADYAAEQIAGKTVRPFLAEWLR